MGRFQALSLRIDTLFRTRINLKGLQVLHTNVSPMLCVVIRLQNKFRGKMFFQQLVEQWEMSDVLNGYATYHGMA